MSGNLKDLIKSAESEGASDVHLLSGSSPMMRVNGTLKSVSGSSELDEKSAESLCFEILDDDLMAVLKEQGELNLSHEFSETSRYRVNIHFEGGTVSGHFRKIPKRIPDMDELGLPKVVSELANQASGVVLVSGPASSGKTTTCAALLSLINSTRAASVLTVENPVEFSFRKGSSLIRHREVGRDVPNLRAAVAGIMKQDINVAFLGDCLGRDDYLALTDAGMSGALILATTLSNSAVETIDNYFSHLNEGERSWGARSLANNLRAVVNQRILPGSKGKPALAYELLLPTPEVRDAIREQNLKVLGQLLKKDQHKTGMVTLNQSLMSLLIKRRVELKDAFMMSPDPEDLDQILKKAGI